jgi:hypothetical protein
MSKALAVSSKVIPIRKEIQLAEVAYSRQSKVQCIKNKLLHIGINWGLISRVDKEYDVISD